MRVMRINGTSAMSAKQWAGMMEGDESYAGARSFFRFEKTVKELTGFRLVIPVHQGRAAEKILFTLVGGRGKFVPNNTHFDTTRANVEFSGATATDLPVAIARETQAVADFKGNMDVAALEAHLNAPHIGVYREKVKDYVVSGKLHILTPT